MSIREDTLMQLCATPLHGSGTVRAVSASGLLTVDTANGERIAARAASCLVAPAVGDKVWLCGDLAEGLYVTAVLAHAQAGAQRIRLPAGSSIEVTDGALTLRAEALNLQGGQLALQADSAALCVGSVTGVGREATWSFGRIKIVSDLLESFAERFVQFSRWSLRTVEGIDQVRSRQIDYRADQLMQLQAENLVANAANLAKLDGEQIHLG
ncbi:DUF3540 domain-containing protein [Variovorax beijingensis]|uniref:DUF3540 domain-containing protein n=1 Tax=Variovorax beijingensis TaxID=2496117 RepID=A0A3P3ETU3_9BURK|nr:DUF3540 domain-containing protein [Variovorax beijingensis]RRH89242.1 DUF3540 domain-containing protein [Variovorax beijingensis]RSZ36549.1 DUF3540 domain-containing protein [Variovorax beijingensis]